MAVTVCKNAEKLPLPRKKWGGGFFGTGKKKVTCYYPLQAYEILNKKSPNDKKLIVFDETKIGKNDYKPIKLACSQCYGCKLMRSKQWAIRCFHESQMFDKNCFITLTFNEESINKTGTLIKSDFQKFMKRLRKKHKGVKTVFDKNNQKKNRSGFSTAVNTAIN